MKLEVLQENLSKGLAIASRFVASRPQLPVLTNILFLAEKNNKLRLTATNLEIGIQYWLGAKVEESGQLTVPAKELTEFISYLSAGKLALESKKKTQLEVNSQSGKAVFSGMNAAEFPKIPVASEDKTVSLPIKSLAEAVNRCSFAAAADDTRPVLAAIYWQFTANGYRMVATDGYRLSMKDISGVKLKLNNEKEMFFLIPARSLMEVTRLVNLEETIKVGLTKDGNQVIFLLPDWQLSSRLIEGEFPDYQKIIPQETKTKISLEREEFYQAVKIASVFARESANIVKFVLKKGQMIITANAPSMGENKTEINTKIKGPELSIAFNYRFILDFLNAIPDEEEEVILEFNDALSPGVFKIASDPSWLHIIMPVRIDI